MADAKRVACRKQLVQAKYTDCDATVNDLMATITSYQNLKVKLENCRIPNVGKRNLMVLRGTIPVPYRSNTYNIPVIIWIPHNYPQSAPLCWVDPTSDMTIKVSKSVDHNGKIYLPYLSEWTSNNSDLLGAIQVMIITFSESMPLYAKPKPGHNVNVHPPVDGQSGLNGNVMGQPQASTATTSMQPNPPYPTTFNSHPTYPGYNNYPAPNPAMPPPYPSGPSNVPGAKPPNLPFSNSGYAYPPVPPSSGYQPNSSLQYPPAAPGQNQNQYQQNQSQTNANSGVGNAGNFDTIQPKHFRDSLETAVADEIRKNVKEIDETAKAEIQVLKKTAEDLNAGRQRLDNLIKEIETKLVDLSQTKEKIREKDRQIEVQLSKMDSSAETPSIDECFGPVQPLYKQLINCFVEENAIVDTIYHLNHALQRGVIDIDVFTKHVKELSRRQFMMRALMKLCREKARLPA